LLVLSRSERGRVEIDPEPLNLVRLVRRIADLESERHPNRRYSFTAPGTLPLVNGEETYVEQVVRNYLSNAEKYSPAAMPIQIEMSVDAPAGEVSVRVLDRGIGVDVETGARAFELFYRTTDATRVAHGAGIGLFVCRELIRAMGGRTWMLPREGGGTEVGFSLPVTEFDDVEGD
jgi:two-component system sensor histidine kinase MprB